MTRGKITLTVRVNKQTRSGLVLIMFRNNNKFIFLTNKENRTSKKSVDGRSTSSHGNKKFRSRSVEKQRGMAFGFRKKATAVVKPDR